MKTTKLARIMAGAAVTGLVITGCANGADSASTGSGVTGTTSSPTSAGQGERNEADVEFAQGMLVHHRQAVEMAALAPGRSENAQLLDLAGRISAAQTPEIATMIGWLQKWGAEVPAEGAMSSGGMDQGGMGGGGMMSPEQMQSLEQANGVAFDRLFLDMMVEHHKSAVEMARTELDEGADPEAEQLAQTITETQQREITEMETLLQQL